jgi:hypothetical protein
MRKPLPKPDGLPIRFDQNWDSLRRSLQKALISEREAHAAMSQACGLCHGPLWGPDETSHYGLLCAKCRWDVNHDSEAAARYLRLVNGTGAAR